MPETADNLARDYQITREACDVFAAGSQRKYAAGKASGFFSGEIFAVEVPGGRAGPVKIGEDEHPRPQTDLAALARLRPLAEGGVTTAGNASGINDGAVAMIVASRKAGDAAGAGPLVRVRASAVAGVPPRIMGIGPVAASKKALARAGLSLADIDVIEINEAFAAQVLACLRGLDLRVRRQPGQPEWRGDRGGPPVRRLRAAHRPDRGAPARTHRRPLRAGDDVRRRRPGHRRGARAGVTARRADTLRQSGRLPAPSGRADLDPPPASIGGLKPALRRYPRRGRT